MRPLPEMLLETEVSVWPAMHVCLSLNVKLQVPGLRWYVGDHCPFISD